jgi:hypothetical protein
MKVEEIMIRDVVQSSPENSPNWSRRTFAGVEGEDSRTAQAIGERSERSRAGTAIFRESCRLGS